MANEIQVVRDQVRQRLTVPEKDTGISFFLTTLQLCSRFTTFVKNINNLIDIPDFKLIFNCHMACGKPVLS